MWSIVVRKGKIVVIAKKRLTVVAEIGKVVSLSASTKMAIVMVNHNLLNLWVLRGAYLSARVLRLLEGVVYVDA
jgi:ribosomal protein S16